jgi:hypothetical protein
LDVRRKGVPSGRPGHAVVKAGAVGKGIMGD